MIGKACLNVVTKGTIFCIPGKQEAVQVSQSGKRIWGTRLYFMGNMDCSQVVCEPGAGRVT